MLMVVVMSTQPVLVSLEPHTDGYTTLVVTSGGVEILISLWLLKGFSFSPF